jgi:peptidyl-prolyl cis-trans isomerase A (cyclophilin A)
VLASLFLLFSTEITAASTLPSIPDAIVPAGGKGLVLNLGKYFPTPFVPTNASVTVPTNAVYVNTSLGDFYIQLFPTNTPITVANFLRYVNTGLYNGMTVERSVPGFVIQTGGYYINHSLNYSAVPNFGTIASEAGISNLTGKVAMALSTGSNSATSAWFINLADNSSQLDGTNDGGPFTVFGQVLGVYGNSNNMEVPDGIEALPTNNYGGPFASLPLRDWTSNSTLAYTNLVIITNMATIPSVVCSDTNSFSVAIQGTNVVITPIGYSRSPATIWINTVDTNGRLLSKTFQVSTQKLRQNVYIPVTEINYSPNGYNFFNTGASSSSGLGINYLAIKSGPASFTSSLIYFKSPGVVTLVATQSGNFFYYPAAATGYIIVDRAPQSITFPTIPNQTNVTVNTTWQLSTNYPTASSGLPVSITVAGPARITGKSLLISGAGTVTLTAKQPGNPNYYSATPVTNSFTVTLKQ